MKKLLLTVLTLGILTSATFAGISSVHDRKGPRSDAYEKQYQLYPNYFDPNFP
ncbi:MAG TPA: hypothetical protein VMW10_10205 [Alphaproteobacteria bacterium]|nr:hypothetical protein [Alphaproteobacteria bacterium]